MAKLIFLQNNSFDLHGPMYISGMLKHHGHSCQLFVVPQEDDVFALLKEAAPDFVAFPIVSIERFWALEFAERVKQETGAITIFGGVDPTMCPEIIEHESVDIVCRGEGEYPLLDLLDSFDKTGKICTDIENLWFKIDGNIIKNPVRRLVEDLDTLPLVDRELYFGRYPFFRDYPLKRILVGRGCPCECTYCCNSKMHKDIYRGKGKWVRRHSVEYVINEIIKFRDTHGIRSIDFIDDDFIVDKPWLRSFLEIYKQKINLPYTCLVRINVVDDETAALLKETGCFTVSFGVESGDEVIRCDILKKHLKDDEIFRGAALLKKHNLKYNTFNILNHPGETIESGFKTVDINIKIKADFPQCSIFQPFPGTQFWDENVADKSLAEQEEFLRTIDFYSSSNVRQEDTRQLTNLAKLFSFAVKNQFFRLIMPALIKLPPNKFFHFMFLVAFAFRHAKANRMSILEEIKFNTKHLEGYFKKKK